MNRRITRGSRRTRPGLELEALEGRALLTIAHGFTLADVYDAADNMNLERLFVKQSIEQAQADSTGAHAQVIADGQFATESLAQNVATIRGFLAQDQAAGDFQTAAQDRLLLIQTQASVRRVRHLMQTSETVGNTIDGTLGKDSQNATRLAFQGVRRLHQGQNPFLVQQQHINAIDRAGAAAQAHATSGQTALANLDNAILNLNPFVPVTPIQLNGTFSGTYTDGPFSGPNQGNLNISVSSSDDLNGAISTAISDQLTQFARQKYGALPPDTHPPIDSIQRVATVSNIAIDGSTVTGNYTSQGGSGSSAYNYTGTFTLQQS